MKKNANGELASLKTKKIERSGFRWVTFLFYMLKIFLCYFLFLHSLFSLEIILKNGDAFICDFVEESERVLKVRWKEKIYEIPKTDILTRDNKKTGTHKGYSLSTIVMLDGTIVKGNIAEETKETLTVQTILGYLALDKEKISEIQRPDPAQEVILHKDFLDSSFRLNPHKFGIHLYGAGNGQPVSEISPGIYGGGLFFEPANFSWKDKWQIGFQSEFLSSIGEGARYNFYNQILYLQYRKKFSRWLDFYFNFGMGGAYIRYKKEEAYIEGVQGLVHFSMGYQALKFGKFTIRIGPRVTQYLEKPFYHNIGGEIALFYSF